MRTISSKSITVIVFGFVCVAGANLVQAQIPPGDFTIELEPVVTGLAAPLSVTHAGDGSGRLFIPDQPGQIWIVQDGELLTTPFLDISDKLLLDISDKLPELNAFFDERGLLGLAFHPQYRVNGQFFVRYPGGPPDGDGNVGASDLLALLAN